MPLFFTFYFSIYDTLQNMVQQVHITQPYMMRQAFCEWSCCYYTTHITYILVMRLRQAWFWHGTGGLKVTVSSGNFWPFSPTGTRTCAPHIRGSSRAVSEWQPAYPRQLIIQTVHILQLDSALTDSLPRGSTVRPFQPYFPITWPSSSTVTPPYQYSNIHLATQFL